MTGDGRIDRAEYWLRQIGENNREGQREHPPVKYTIEDAKRINAEYKSKLKALMA